MNLEVSNAKDIYKSFKANKFENANIIIDLLKQLEVSDVKALRKALIVIHKIFCQLLKDGDMKKNGLKNDRKNPVLKYINWLCERYCDLHNKLIELTLDVGFPLSLRELSLVVIIKLIQKEACHPITPEKVLDRNFPVQRLTNFYRCILFSGTDCTALLKKLQETFQCPDFLYFSLHVLSELVTNTKEDETPYFIQNLVALLDLMRLPEREKTPLAPPTLFISINEEFSFPHENGKKIFNEIWTTVLQMKLTHDVINRCLVILPEKVMMHLEEPVWLTDFFMNAYNIGGISSLLAMHGVYILVTQYNLEYPDFYKKVYALYDSAVFNPKYKRRFFTLCNKFFLSPYLPEYIVAAFIKKTSRMMLTAPSSCLILLIKFVVNLLLRFPSLKRLVNSPTATSLTDDPFLADETDLALCRAGESSLWEIASLTHHPLREVCKAANFIYRNLPEVEYDIQRFVDMSYEDLYSKANKIKTTRVATTFIKPEGLFKYSEDEMSSVWDII